MQQFFTKLLYPIDYVIDRITMYRLVLYYLVALVLLAMVFGSMGYLPYSAADIFFSVAIITAAGLILNSVFAHIFNAPENVESIYITALIIALIMKPVASTDMYGIGALLMVSLWAVVSKFLLAHRNQHIFNPAAFGVAVSALLLGYSANWWVGGNMPLMWLVVIGGLLVIRKLRRFDLILAFFASSAVITLITFPSDAVSVFWQTLLHTPIFYFAFAMLSEPLTMPGKRSLRIAYGVLAGILISPAIHIGNYYFTPETALLAANLFSYAVSQRRRFILKLTERRPLAQGVYEFVFASDYPMVFRPGQYLEWTLGHRKPDSRGNRRFFTIASAPEEREVRLGVRMFERGSSFKRSLMDMPVGTVITASHIAGDFTLPTDGKKKLAFIAGGIGITPYMSMLRHLLKKGEQRDMVMLYSVGTAGEIAYKNELAEAIAKTGLRLECALTNEPPQEAAPHVHYGMINREMIERTVPDHKERTFFLSGPSGMVRALGDTLLSMGVPRRNIKKDFFPGLV